MVLVLPMLTNIYLGSNEKKKESHDVPNELLQPQAQPPPARRRVRQRQYNLAGRSETRVDNNNNNNLSQSHTDGGEEEEPPLRASLAIDPSEQTAHASDFENMALQKEARDDKDNTDSHDQLSASSSSSSYRIEGDPSGDADGDQHHSLPHPDDHAHRKSANSLRTNRQKMFQTIAGVAGNVLEWYDFAVYGYFADIIGQNFFPPQEGNSQLVESFAVFGIAFLMRPVGGCMMGYIGDVYGRKRALEISIFLMALPTFTMGLLPTYESIGWTATLLLITVRMLQGLSVGGQLVSSLVFTLENQPREKWGLYGSYVMASANFGTLLGSVLATVLKHNMDEQALTDWGWRLPFLSGVLVLFSGIYLRFYCEDDTMEHAGSNAGDAIPNPIKVAFAKGNRRALISASLVPSLWATGFYINFVWMPTFMEKYANYDGATAALVNSVSLFLSVCILFPLAGIASDWYGRARVMYLGGIILVLVSPLMFIWIGHGNPLGAFCAQFILGISLSLWGAPMCSWLVESFPSHVRLTSVAIGYNIALAFFGGASGWIATEVAEHSSSITNGAPGFLISAVSIVAMVGLFLQPRPQERANRAHEVLADLTLEEEGGESYDGDQEGRRRLGSKEEMIDEIELI